MAKDKQNHQKVVLQKSLLTGFVGGILAGVFSLFMYYFNFIEITPKSYLLKSWLNKNWVNGWLGDTLSVFFIGILSIMVALIYYLLFKKIFSIWLGLVYGTALWIFMFLIIHPLFPGSQKLMSLKLDTIVSTLCLFLLYGIFIGYSISYDYTQSMFINKENE